MDPIDDTALADFLAGRLAPARRAEIIRHLASSEDARERLRLAYLALEASQDESQSPVLPSPPLRRAAPARPARRHASPLRHLSRVAVVVTLLVGTAAVLRFALQPAPDLVRTRTEDVVTLEARISPRTLALDWNAVAGADHYEVLVWDEVAAEEVVAERVETAGLPADGAFASALRLRLALGRRYAVQVTAFDATNRRLTASALLPFRYDG